MKSKISRYFERHIKSRRSYLSEGRSKSAALTARSVKRMLRSRKKNTRSPRRQRLCETHFREGTRRNLSAEITTPGRGEMRRSRGKWVMIIKRRWGSRIYRLRFLPIASTPPYHSLADLVLFNKIARCKSKLSICLVPRSLQVASKQCLLMTRRY